MSWAWAHPNILTLGPGMLYMYILESLGRPSGGLDSIWHQIANAISFNLLYKLIKMVEYELTNINVVIVLIYKFVVRKLRPAGFLFSANKNVPRCS